MKPLLSHSAGRFKAFTPQPNLFPHSMMFFFNNNHLLGGTLVLITMQTFYIKPNTQNENIGKRAQMITFFIQKHFLPFKKQTKKICYTCQEPNRYKGIQNGEKIVNIFFENAGSPDGKLTNK